MTAINTGSDPVRIVRRSHRKDEATDCHSISFRPGSQVIGKPQPGALRLCDNVEDRDAVIRA